MKRTIDRLMRISTYCLIRALQAPSMHATNWWADLSGIAEFEIGKIRSSYRPLA